ncbi:glycosyltransferase, partial [Petrachloros mirabilis]
MRLAFTIFTYFPFGGLQRDCLDIAETCRKRGHDITLFTMEWSGPIPEGIQLRIIRSKGLTNHARSNSFVKAVLPRLQSGKFDVVVGFNKMPGLDLYFAGDPCYVEQSRKRHGPRWNPYYWATLRYHRYSAFERAVFGPQSVTEILPLSASQERIYSAHYGTPANRFHLLPPGICHDRTPSHDDSGIRSEIRRSFLRESEKHLL